MNSTVFSYTAYGLGFESEIQISGPPPGAASKDVQIRRGKVTFPPDAQEQWTWKTENEVFCRISNVGAIQVSRGCEVVVDSLPDVKDATIGLYLMGPVLGILLQQRGLLVLHGSAVSFNGGIAAFLGNSGWGKSTMAGAMAKRGHPVVTDDIVGVQVGDQMLTVPGLPRLKLKEETAEALGYSRSRLRPLVVGDDRRELLPNDVSFTDTKPLEHIYILAEGDVPEIEPLGSQDAVAELMRHSYAVSCLKGAPNVFAYLRLCAALVGASSICRLRRPLRLERAEEVAKLVESNMTMHKNARIQSKTI